MLFGLLHTPFRAYSAIGVEDAQARTVMPFEFEKPSFWADLQQR
jgi:hypothetical protein